MTCGEDGDVRIWQTFDDIDSVSISIGEKCTAITQKNSKLYVANEMNEVKKYDLNTNEYLDLITTFTLNVTCICVNKSDTQLLCGSADFEIRLIELNDASMYKYTQFSGHNAPILDVCFDPLEKYFVSSSCDGTIKFWSIRTQMNIKTLSNMHPKSNDFANSKTYSKLSWHKDANLIAIPTFKCVQFYERELWQLKFKIDVKFDDESDKDEILASITKFSPDGKHVLICTTPNETIYIHSIITKALICKYSYTKSKLTSRICSIAWNLNNQNDVLFCDFKGQMGIVKVNLNTSSQQQRNDDNLNAEDLLALINDDDSNEGSNKALNTAKSENDEDDKPLVISRKKAKNDIKSPSSKKRKRLNSDDYMGINNNDESSNDTVKTTSTKDSSDSKVNTDGGFNMLDDDEAIDIDEIESIEKLKEKTLSSIKREFNLTDEQKQNNKKLDFLIKNHDQILLKENLKDNLLNELNLNQKPFQCASTPMTLDERYMVWNTVGIIKQFNLNADKSIDIEFHNVSYHHTIHINNNQYGYTMADLSKEAVLLACPGSKSLQYKHDDDIGDGETETNENELLTIEQQFNESRLVCILLNPWDTLNKEWSINMPKKEFIKCICVSNQLCACFTSNKFLRVFTLNGVQREVIAIPCINVLCMSAYNNFIFISYYKTNSSFNYGETNLISYSLICINISNDATTQSSQYEHGELALSDRAKLAWLGFSDEGNPYYYDTNGYIYTKYLNTNLWTPVCYLKANLKHKSDKYWLVGVAERLQQCRGIILRGSGTNPQQYPTVIPKPTIDILQLQMPLCETNSEKSQLEQDYWKYKLISNNIKNYETSMQLYNSHVKGENNDQTSQTIGNIDFDQDDIDELNEKLTKQLRESLMKMFILACKANKDQRAYEIANIMDTHALQLAIKYATKARYLLLAQNLNRLAEIKAANEVEMQMKLQQEHNEQFKSSSEITYKREISNNASDVASASTSEIHNSDNDIIPLTNQSEMSSTSKFEISSCLTPTNTTSIASSGIPLSNTRFNPFKTSNSSTSQNQTPTLQRSNFNSPSVMNDIEDKLSKQQQQQQSKEKENKKDVWKPTTTRKLTKAKVATPTNDSRLDSFFCNKSKASEDD